MPFPANASVHKIGRDFFINFHSDFFNCIVAYYNVCRKCNIYMPHLSDKIISYNESISLTYRCVYEKQKGRRSKGEGVLGGILAFY